MPGGVFEVEVGVAVGLLLVLLELVEVLAVVHEEPKTLRDQVDVVLLESEAHQQTD